MTRSPLLIVMCAGYFLVLLAVTVVNSRRADAAARRVLHVRVLGGQRRGVRDEPVHARPAAHAAHAVRGQARGPVRAMVAAAVGSAGAAPGLASGGSTARQAGGAVGIAIFGAVAGSASNVRAFLSGLHLSGVASALLFLVAGLSTVLMRSN